MRKKLMLVLVLLSSSLLGFALPDDSLYNLTSRWNDQAGRSLRLQQLGGKVQVLALVYTHCQSVCPAIINAMKATEARLSAAERAHVGFVLVSIDPAVDTSEQLRDFAGENRFGPGWVLLRGAPEDVRELAATLNFKYRKTTQEDYAHTAMITVLDQQGEIVSQQLGMSGGTEERLREIRKLLRQ